jgi:hypothetical protein
MWQAIEVFPDLGSPEIRVSESQTRFSISHSSDSSVHSDAKTNFNLATSKQVLRTYLAAGLAQIPILIYIFDLPHILLPDGDRLLRWFQSFQSTQDKPVP